MSRLFVLFLLFCSIPISSKANSTPVKFEYHSVKVNKGDGVYSLLRRYKLLENPCNLKHFYALNKMSKNESLQVNKKYKLPVMIYTYNGKSIRSTLGINDLQKALRIKSYNEEVRKAKLRKNNFIVSKILWVPYHELNCGEMSNSNYENNNDSTTKEAVSKTDEKLNKENPVAKVTPVKAESPKPKEAPALPSVKSSTISAPIFGKQYESVTVKDKALENQVFYVVSGHGGPDPGARCTDCKEILCEDEYAYDVALRLSKNLMEHGATVHVIIQDDDGIRDDNFLDCDSDETCLGKLPIPRNQKLRLLQRTTAINDLYKVYKKRGVKSQKTISIHIDSNTKDKKMDAYFCYYKNSKASKVLATNLKETFAKKYAYHQKDRIYKGKISPRGFYILRNTAAPAVLVELANIKNKNNQKRFVYPSNRQHLADWLYEGLTGEIL